MYAIKVFNDDNVFIGYYANHNKNTTVKNSIQLRKGLLTNLRKTYSTENSAKQMCRNLELIEPLWKFKLEKI